MKNKGLKRRFQGKTRRMHDEREDSRARPGECTINEKIPGQIQKIENVFAPRQDS